MNNITNAQNPFFGQYQTPHATVPFDRIKTEHYEPAILEGIQQQNAEIDAIILNPEKANFNNTIEAFEESGELLDRERRPARTGSKDYAVAQWAQQ